MDSYYLLEQAEAASGDRIILRRQLSMFDIFLTVAAILLFIPTLTTSLILLFTYLGIKDLFLKIYIVKNVATGEKFRVKKEEYKQYKRRIKDKEKEIKSIS
jgi:UPF0716 family protein affecting phage T7 exclusion